MSYQIELVCCPPTWTQPLGDQHEKAKANFLTHEVEDSNAVDLKAEMDDSNEAPF